MRTGRFILKARAVGWSFSRRGQGLIETVVSIGILAIALALLTQLVVTGLEESARAQRQASSMLFAQEIMEEILAHRGDLAAWELQNIPYTMRKKRLAFFADKQSQKTGNS